MESAAAFIKNWWIQIIFAITVSLSIHNGLKMAEVNTKSVAALKTKISQIDKSVDRLEIIASKGDRYTRQDADRQIRPIEARLSIHDKKINDNENRSIKNEVGLKNVNN